MPTNFPAGSDVFNVPNNPGGTALSSAGTGSANHVQHHKNLGDAIVAMEVEATMANHAHDGSTARFGPQLTQANTHGSPDTDAATTSLHHTLGTGATQAAPGNHASLPAFAATHANTVTWPVGSVYLSSISTNPNTTFGFGTWTRIQDAFLVGVGGSYSYTGSVVSNSTTHGHTVSNTDDQGSHSHTLAGPTDTLSTHKHSGGTSGGSTVGHYHSGLSNGLLDGNPPGADSNYTGGTGFSGSVNHSHYSLYNDNGTNHGHTINDYDYAGSHSHNLSSGVTGSTHNHSVSTNTPSHTPPYQAFYVWLRTA